MTAKLSIKKLQGCSAIICSCMLRKSRLLTLLASTFIIAEASALADVFVSEPEITTINKNTSLSPSPSHEIAAFVSKRGDQTSNNTSTDGGTAYFLGILEQLSQETMLLRGQLEEQAHLIQQVKQDGRDRYLDLDKRITRLSDFLNKPTMTDNNKPVPSRESAEKTSEDATYKKALKLIHDKQFDDAKKILIQQMADFPTGNFADNAQYWLGEVEMAQGSYPDAKNSFLSVLKNHPGSSKVPDATYKLGHLLDLMGDKQQAKNYFETVIRKYPDSTAAKLSDNYLQRLRDA